MSLFITMHGSLLLVAERVKKNKKFISEMGTEIGFWII